MRKLVFLICLTLLSACCKEDDETIPQTKTVLVYMSAENTLSYDSENDLQEIRQGSQELTDDDYLLVYYDRAKKDELPWLARIVKGQSHQIKFKSSHFHHISLQLWFLFLLVYSTRKIHSHRLRLVSHTLEKIDKRKPLNAVFIFLLC